jgi:hypothetical protein
MYKRLVSILLVISMILPLAGCGGETGKPAMSEKLMAEAVLNEENLTLAAEGVELRLHPVIISADVNASISQVSNAPPLDAEDDIDLKVYDFKLEGIDQVDGVIQLAIPLEIPNGNVAGAAYLNETTGVWEPVSFYYDDAASSIVILTDHLSKYGVFSISKEGTRRARLEFLGLYGEGSDENFLAAIEEYSIGGVPASECYEIGMGAVGDAMQLGGDILGNISQSAGYLAYGDDVLSTIGDHLGSIGLLLSVVQISNNIYNGNINDAVVGSLKTSLTYVMGKVASKLSSSVMSASMASVAIVDYAINKFGTTAIEGRADIYRDAYSIYYFKGQDGFKSSAYWYKTFYPLFRDPNLTQEALKTEIDKIVTGHCNEFWTGANKLGVDYFVSEAREKMKWTGGGAGLNKDLQDSISKERRSNLYNDVLPGVFYQIAQKINMDNEAKLRSQYKELTDYLNTVISFSAKDPKKSFAKHMVRFASLNEKAVLENWTGKIKDDGTLNTSFTLYGHLTSGSPTKLNIYEPEADLEKDEPIKTVEFKVTPPLIELVLSDDDMRLTRLVTMISSDDAVDDLLQVDEFKSYYAEDLFPVPLEHLLSQQPITIPKDNVIDISFSGSWAAEPVSDTNTKGGEWSTSYKYDISNFSLNATLGTNTELPVKGTEKTALMLDGKGTYSYTVTITTVTTGYQETVALFEKAWTTGSKTRTITFNSSGDVELYTYSKKIDENKDVIAYEKEIDNLETTAVVLAFVNPVNSVSGIENHYTHVKWEDGQEKEETSTNDIVLDPSIYLESGAKILFKYPVQ